jgi:hypothetical protein
VCVRRATQPDAYAVYLCQLADPLPTLAIPLGRHDLDVSLNLQVAMDDAYRAGNYGKVVDYRQPPPPPDLTPEQRAWVDARLAPLRTPPAHSEPR